MKTLVVALTTLFALSFANTASAHRPAKRQHQQKHRIKRGLKTGELTKKEAVALKRDQNRIQRAKRKARADGTVTRAERLRIQQKQNRASQKIFVKKHNRRSR